MSRVWRIFFITCGILLLLGLALMGVSFLTGGSIARIISTTDIADMTKFFTREQIDTVVSILFH